MSHLEDSASMLLHWKEVVKYIKQPTLLLNKNQEVIAINNAVLSTLKKPDNEIIGKPCFQVFHETKCPPTKCPCCSILNSNTSEITEMEIEAFGGYYLISCTPLYNKNGELENILHIATDITDQKNIQHALEQSEYKYKNLISAIPEGIIVHCDGIIEFANEASAKIMKAQSPHELIGKKALDFVHPDFQTFAVKRIQESFHNNSVVPPAEELFINFRGEPVFVEVSAIPYNFNGKKALLTVISDISKRKSIEEELIIKNNAFNSSLTASCIANKEGLICHVNQSFLDLFKYKDQKEALGQKLKLIFKDSDEITPVYKSLANDEKWVGDFTAITNDGYTFIAFGIASVLHNNHGEIIGYQAECYDVSQQRQNEKLLQEKNLDYQRLNDALRHINEELIYTKLKIEESEEKFRVLVENIPGAVYLCKNDATYTMIFLSEMIEQITGYPASAFLDGSMNITDLYHPDEYDYIFKSVDESLAKHSQFHIIYRLKNISGDWCWVEEFGRGLYQNGELLSLEGVIFDISLVKKTEVQLMEQNIQIAAQNEELHKAKEKAEESDRLKSAFLANMSHEIRTPMNAICGFSDLLLDSSLSDEKKQKFVQIIHTNSQQLLGIINDIIDISKIEAGQISVTENKFSINALFSEIETIFTPVVKSKYLELVTKKGLSDNECFIIADDLKLKQIFNNLIFNAIKFTRAGYIEFGYSIEDNFINFYVKDTGIGIPPDKHETAFERFRQIENNMGSRSGGTGLGLSISRAYAELMGGKMWLMSELGKGSVFHFNIPYKPVNIVKTKVMHDPSNLDLSHYTFLVAEDDDINYYFLTEILLSTKVNIIRARDGQEVIDLFKSKKLDLILMDIKMPIIDGLKATMEIRKVNTQIPIIAQTAYAFASDKENALHNGCTDFIAKPVKKNELLDLIKKYLIK